MKSRIQLIASFVIVVGLLVATIIGRIHVTQQKIVANNTVPPSTTEVFFGGVLLHAQVADTEAARVHGLSGTSALLPDQAMLFVFDAPGLYSFWMKDMHYPIDIVWIDDTKHVVFIKENATPESYPTEFVSEVPARYVLEVGSGFIEHQGVKVGDVVMIAR